MAAAMPPWAYSVLDSYRSSLVRTRTRPPFDSSIAALIPAIPPPRTIKSTLLSLCFTMVGYIIAGPGLPRKNCGVLLGVFEGCGIGVVMGLGDVFFPGFPPGG